jgi:hypothetical protein
MTLIKNKSLFGLMLLTAMIILWGCKKYAVKAIDENSIALYDCSPETTAPYICFDSLITDSRCPEGGECFWRGNATIKVSFHERGNVHTFKMGLKGYPWMGFPPDTTISGYKIEFIDLTPYPNYFVPAPKASEIRATFNITH